MTTYYCSNTGSDSNPGTEAEPFLTIQHAMQYMAAGTILNVQPGTYAGFIVGWDDDAATGGDPLGYITGTAAAPIVIQATPGSSAGSVIIDSANSETAVGIHLEPGNSYVVINGFTITNTSGTITQSGIQVSSPNITISNCVVSGVTGWGVLTGGADYFTITGCTVTGTLEGEGGGSLTGHGIYCSNSSEYCTVSNCIVSDNQYTGIQFNGDGGVMTACLITGNVIYGNGQNAINCDGLQSSVISNNLIYNYARSGIVLFQIDASGPPTNNLIVNNTIWSGSSEGTAGAIAITNSGTGNTVLNNILFDPNYVYSISSSCISGFTSNYNAVLSGALIQDADNSDTETFATWKTSSGSPSTWPFETGQDANSITTSASATFLDSASNYQEKSTSPTVAAGTAADAPAADILGVPRCNGSGYDIGCYQIGTAVPAASVLHHETWDSASPPAMPSGWNAQTDIATTATGPTPISSPNMVQVASSSGAFYTATWGTRDGNSGNVAVQASGCDGTLVSAISGAFSAFGRSSASTTAYGSSTFYEAQCNLNTQTVALNKVVAGTSTTLASVSTTALDGGTWYVITLTCYKSYITVQLGRQVDGYYLGPYGAFGPGAVTLISLADSSITGSGYAGWSADSYASLSKVYGDDWYLSGLGSASGPPAPYTLVPTSVREPAQRRRPGRVWLPTGTPQGRSSPLAPQVCNTVRRKRRQIWTAASAGTGPPPSPPPALPVILRASSPRRLHGGFSYIADNAPNAPRPIQPHPWRPTIGGQPRRRGHVLVQTPVIAPPQGPPATGPLQWNASRRKKRVIFGQGFAQSFPAVADPMHGPLQWNVARRKQRVKFQQGFALPAPRRRPARRDRARSGGTSSAGGRTSPGAGPSAAQARRRPRAPRRRPTSRPGARTAISPTGGGVPATSGCRSDRRRARRRRDWCRGRPSRPRPRRADCTAARSTCRRTSRSRRRRSRRTFRSRSSAASRGGAAMRSSPGAGTDGAARAAAPVARDRRRTAAPARACLAPRRCRRSRRRLSRIRGSGSSADSRAGAAARMSATSCSSRRASRPTRRTCSRGRSLSGRTTAGGAAMALC